MLKFVLVIYLKFVQPTMSAFNCRKVKLKYRYRIGCKEHLKSILVMHIPYSSRAMSGMKEAVVTHINYSIITFAATTGMQVENEIPSMSMPQCMDIDFVPTLTMGR